ncbi:MAG: TorF family putative porin [Pseudomonadota bacterium]|nr:TorF family putative porin [Pseudomonadota bacterium]
MSTTTRSTIALTFLLATTAALAEDKSPEPDYSVAYNIGAVSDYRVRGIAQTDFRPAVQAGIDFAHKSGFYLGTFASNVNWVKDFNGATKGNVEVDLYGGFKDAITSDISFDTGVIRYEYVGNNSGADGTPGAGAFANASTTEVYLMLTYKIVNLKYNRSVGNFLGNLNSSGSQYFDLNAGFDLGNSFTLTPHIGHQMIPNQGDSGNLGDYTDYSLALAKDFGNGVVVTATVLGTNTKKGAGTFYRDMGNRDLGKSTATLGVKYTF